MWQVLQGNALDVLKTLASESVHCCVTSPPYWGLRSYLKDDDPLKPYELGAEATPEEYVQHMVEVFREVRRVLRRDGTLWIVLGDCFAHPGKGGPWDEGRVQKGTGAVLYSRQANRGMLPGIKSKDLVGIPWRVAFALQQSYASPVCVKNKIDRAWLAAMFDGEGCIGIRRFDSYRKAKQQVYQDGFVVYTVVTNSDIELLNRCIAITGLGKVTLKSAAGSCDDRGIVSRRDSYVWRLDGNGAVDVICTIYPYLIAKRKQACIAYTLDQLNKHGHGARRVPQDIQEKKRLLWELIKRCNQREAIDLPDWVTEPKQHVELGWYLRMDNVWAKPNPMPESVTDRPTRSHEYVFLFAKSESYFYDSHAIREPGQEWPGSAGTFRRERGKVTELEVPGQSYPSHRPTRNDRVPPGRNKHSVWTIPTRAFPGAHFATYPPDLVEICIKAGTSTAGCCPKCGAPWVRITEEGEPDREWQKRCGADASGSYQGKARKNYTGAGVQDASAVKARILAGMRQIWTVGWRPTCSCDAGDPIPCTVLDPFAGAGTTLFVAEKLGRNSIGIELNPSYIEDIIKPRMASIKYVEHPMFA